MPELHDLEAVLRDLPRPAFKQRLRESMETQTITPYVVATDVDAVIEFVKNAFDAEELLRSTGSAGGTHCELRIGDSKIMLGGGGPGRRWSGAASPAALHLYVPDVDAAYRRAIEAGATSVMPPTDQEYGDRDSALKDPAGNEWYLATSKGPGYKPEGLKNVTMYMHPKGADELREFLERAFGAETVERHASPQGVVLHAKLKIGNSMLEMGEAHANWPPMESMVYLSVPDTDATYERAIAAGAESIQEPSDAPYGARVGAVKDPAGNQWYMAGPLKA